MFAENRVHQRSSGRPYPNKVVMKVDRSEKKDKEYKLVTLENKYVKIEILPEIGGRVYSAYDKTTGYDFFYKQHVIKPALIGVLGSWISGGVEFNWPFHHRASGFMPCDFKLEQLPDGSAVCWLSEHDPIDRMKGMVGIVLRPDCSYFETRMRLYNRTPDERSFLWWENAAVPVNESYQIFFPEDVKYVNFHYLKSRITYPVAANGVFNGIPMQEGTKTQGKQPHTLLRLHSLTFSAVMTIQKNAVLFVLVTTTFHPVKKCLLGLMVSWQNLGKTL